MRIVVTGASGRVGSATVRELVSRGHIVVAVDVRPPASTTSGAVWHRGDVLDPSFLTRAFEGCDVLINVAGYNHPTTEKPWDAYGVNVLGSFTSMHVAARTGITRSVHASSASALGFAWASSPHQPHYLPIDHAHPAEPADHYGLSKLATELSAQSLCREFDHAAIAIRFPQAVDDTSLALQVAAVDRDPAAGVPLRDFWSYIHIDDIARAFADAAESSAPGFELVTVVAPDTLSRRDTEALIADHYPGVPLRRRIEGRAPAWDLTDAHRVLGRLPTISWMDREAS